MKKFELDVDEADLQELFERVERTRWPLECDSAPTWDAGIPSSEVRRLAEVWVSGFDWRAVERSLNALPQFTTPVGEQPFHFIHARSAAPDAVPILLTHGWPGSVLEFLDLIPLLTRGDRPFHVVAPSLPGFGPGPAPRPGTRWSTASVARAWAELMRTLGYDEYVVQGGDWGGPISLELAAADPEHVLACHVNMLVTFPPPDLSPQDLSQEQLQRLTLAQEFADLGSGWQKIQSTRPSTLAHGLSDSPVGQLAWVAEKFNEWSGGREPQGTLSDETVLAHATLYWLFNASGPSARFYCESTRTSEDFMRVWGGPWPTRCPVGVAVFPGDAALPIREFAESSIPTLTHWSEFTSGGHFAALERPEALAEDIRSFVTTALEGS